MAHITFVGCLLILLKEESEKQHWSFSEYLQEIILILPMED